MEIQLDLIQPSSHPIRSSWDEDKMMELTNSIKEQGLIVPIKIRPTANEHYEIVYGHRRAEACRRAGLDTIDAIVEGLENIDTLIQALIENVQKEDMSALDTARALRSIKTMTGFSNRDLEKKGIFSYSRARELETWLAEYEKGLAVDVAHAQHDEGVRKTIEIKRAFDRQQIADTEPRRAVAEKVTREQLTYPQTREVAELVASAGDEAERQAILETPYDEPAFDRLVRVRADIHREQQREQQRKRQDDPREVKAFLESVRTFRAVCREAVAVVDYGKFSPEARRFAIRQLDQLLDDIQALKQTLEVQDV